MDTKENMEEIPSTDKVEEKEITTQPKAKWANYISYFRELSVVIIGILITLAITTTINNHNRQRELKGMLTLVKEELIENRQTLESIKEKWEKEQHLFQLLRVNRKDITQIPADTLNDYTFAIGSLYRFNAKNESYDVLKSSILIQYIKEKKLQYSLSALYSSFSSLDNQLKSYSERKANLSFPLLEEMNDEQIEESIYKNNAVDFFQLAIKNDAYRKFLITGGTILSPGYMDEILAALTEMIREMEGYGY